jgi:hypothetical protein
MVIRYPNGSMRIVEDDEAVGKVATADGLTKGRAGVPCTACNGTGVVPRGRRVRTSPNTDPPTRPTAGAGETAIPKPDLGLPQVEQDNPRGEKRAGFGAAMAKALATPEWL